MKCTKLLVAFLLLLASNGKAQGLTTLPDGGNKKASVSELIGITDVVIHYDRPGVKGREGKIWGGLVPYGFNDLGFGTSKASPWRAGANENTTISFTTDVEINGQPLAAGVYGLSLAMKEDGATVIFSHNATSWGSFFYDPKDDALRVEVKSEKTKEETERLTYEFSNQTENSAQVSMCWEYLRVPFTVSVDYVKTQMESFRRELKSNKGFRWEAWVQAANFAIARHTNLDEALAWSNYAIEAPFVGQKNFNTLSCKASVLSALGRADEAASLMKEALPLANMVELHNYGRQLVAEKKFKEAMDAFKLNAQKNPKVFTTNVGLMRGYSANGDFKTALKYAKMALPQAPDALNKNALAGYIQKLGEGKDVN